MGCPKSFSISGGMGAALLNKPELIHDVCEIYHWKAAVLFFLVNIASILIIVYLKYLP